MREGPNAMGHIEEILTKLSLKHAEHLELYGDNEDRMTGTHETSSKANFTSGDGDRSASVRIPTTTAQRKLGYIEDRRPASDIDPYLVCSIIADTALLEISMIKPLLNHYRRWKDENRK